MSFIVNHKANNNLRFIINYNYFLKYSKNLRFFKNSYKNIF